MGIHNVRVDEKLWSDVKQKIAEMAKAGWVISVSDILRAGLMHFLGRANIDQMFNSKENAKADHVEDVTEEQ